MRLTENRNNTIAHHCKNKSIVRIAKVNSKLLGDETTFFYDCSLKGMYVTSGVDVKAPVRFSYGQSFDFEYYFYINGDYSRRVTLVMSNVPKAIVVDHEKTETNLFDMRNLIDSANNMPFLSSIPREDEGYSFE